MIFFLSAFSVAKIFDFFFLLIVSCSCKLLSYIHFVDSVGSLVWFIRFLAWGLSWWLSSKDSTCQCRRQRFDPWSGTIPHATEQLSLCATVVEPVLQSPGTTTTEPSYRNYWSPHILEPIRSNKRSHSNEKRLHDNWRVASLTAAAEKPEQWWRPCTASINKWNI